MIFKTLNYSNLTNDLLLFDPGYVSVAYTGERLF